MNWMFLVKAAAATVASLSSSVQASNVFHGGAQNTVTKVNSALQVLAMFLSGTADALTPQSVHPELAAHAATLAATDAEIQAAA